jgi:hypothetical protein
MSKVENLVIADRSLLAPRNAMLARQGIFERYLSLLFPPNREWGHVGPGSLGYYHRTHRTGTEIARKVML